MAVVHVFLWLKILYVHTKCVSFSVMPLKTVGTYGALAVECTLGCVSSSSSCLALN